ncbi:hypothetical protein ABB25_13920 [Stenotrophomonas koreensis]|uniref:Uncharacterized protein n=1 Tax=Stenotrophomonas koreensis TaxID=266128 RepID=A0A0R0BIW2_9GAMM|nr:hypothetical protein [Stenotrophomonas koreensis]KRG54274.1 hypothetical protein ABB25_13920 [Stenotrophomonas koreensis]
MTSAADAVLALLNTARGQRPYSMENQETEQCFAVTLALAVELIATNDRVDRLERQLAELSGKPLHEVRRSGSDAVAEQERLAANEATLLRTLRVLVDPRPAVDQRPHMRAAG